MTEPFTVISARVDDIPLLLAQLERMGVHPWLDTHVPTHGHWMGLSLGWVGGCWLTHILSPADHRLTQVEPGAEQRLQTLRGCTGQRLPPLDVSDDRLAGRLEALSDDECGCTFEGALNQQLLRVYALQPQRVRLESTTASGSWGGTEAGLFQRGHSQAHRPALPQVQGRLAALDPMGMPVATAVVPGHRADAPLYVPVITRVRASLARRGLRYVGDGTRGALETRAFLQAGGDDYVCPLSALQVPAEVVEAYVAPVWTGPQPVPRIYRRAANGQRQLIADGDERLAPRTAVVGGAPLPWTERRRVIRSRQLAQAGERGLRTRLTKAQAAVAALTARRQGKPRLTPLPAVPAAVEAILRRYRVEGLLEVRYEAQGQERAVRRYRDRPARVQVEREVQVHTRVDQAAVATAVRRRGWRVDATTQPAAQLSLAPAVLASRHEYLIERDRGRLKGRPLSLTPRSLERDDHATGLIRLLSIGWRGLTLLAFVVRRRLAAEQSARAGLYAGTPQRATVHPTAERVLASCEGLTLTIIQAGRGRRLPLTPLSPWQQRVLALLDFSVNIYTRLGAHFRKPP